MPSSERLPLLQLNSTFIKERGFFQLLRIAFFSDDPVNEDLLIGLEVQIHTLLDLLRHAADTSTLPKFTPKEIFLTNGVWHHSQAELEARTQSVIQYLSSFADGVEAGVYPAIFGLYLKALSMYLTFFRLYQPAHAAWATGFESLRRFEKLSLPEVRPQPLRLRVPVPQPTEPATSSFAKAFIGTTLSAVVLFAFNVTN